MSIALDIRERATTPEPMPDALRVVVATSLSGLGEAWSELERHAPDATLFQSLDWCRAWVDASQAAGAPENLRIATIWRAERLVMLWPLAIRRLSGLRILHALGEPATQYGDVLIDPREDRETLLERAWHALLASDGIDAIELRRVPDASPLARLPGLARYAVSGSREIAPVLDFRRLGEVQADAQRSSKSRNALRRHERHLAEHGRIGFEIATQPERVAQLLTEAVALKREWQQHKSAFSSGYAHRASEGALARLAAAGHLLAARLGAGETTAAIEIGAVRRGRYWSLVQSYDLRLSRHAPGRLLFWHLLDACPALSIEIFDFLAPAHRHKLEWSNEALGIGDYVVPVTVRGRLAALYLAWLRPRLRDVYRRLPTPLRSQAAVLIR